MREMSEYASWAFLAALGVLGTSALAGIVLGLPGSPRRPRHFSSSRYSPASWQPSASQALQLQHVQFSFLAALGVLGTSALAGIVLGLPGSPRRPRHFSSRRYSSAFWQPQASQALQIQQVGIPTPPPRNQWPLKFWNVGKIGSKKSSFFFNGPAIKRRSFLLRLPLMARHLKISLLYVVVASLTYCPNLAHILGFLLRRRLRACCNRNKDDLDHIIILPL